MFTLEISIYLYTFNLPPHAQGCYLHRGRRDGPQMRAGQASESTSPSFPPFFGGGPIMFIQSLKSLWFLKKGQSLCKNISLGNGLPPDARSAGAVIPDHQLPALWETNICCLQSPSLQYLVSAALTD